MPPSLPEDDASLLARAGLDPSLPAESGLFRDEGWLRRVSREPVVLFGGARALLLEVAHPLVAAGVAEHSDFRRDPFGRLQRTLAAISALALEPRDPALAAVRGVLRAHERVSGSLAEAVGGYPAGSRYSGRDPELVLWVWGTLVDTALAVYRDFVGPLDDAALAEYHRDQRAIALLLGAPPESTPRDPIGFRRWFDGVLEGDALAVGPAAREIARSVLETPGLERGPVPLLTAALLPEPLREAFGIPWRIEDAERYRRLVASVRAWRPARPVDGPSEDREIPRRSKRDEVAAMDEKRDDEEPRGKVDATSIFYIFGGIPVIVLYLVVLFGLARSCNFPA